MTKTQEPRWCRRIAVTTAAALALADRSAVFTAVGFGFAVVDGVGVLV